MTKKAFVFAVAAVCIGSATSAFAQQYGNDRGQRYEQSQRFEQSQRYEQVQRDGRGDAADQRVQRVQRERHNGAYDVYQQRQRDSRYEQAQRGDGYRYDGDEHDGDRRYAEQRREREQEYRQHQWREARRYDTGYNYGTSYGYASQRGAGPRYDLYQGARLPSAYYGDSYVVSDWRRYNLGAPPRGSHWVRAGNDYVLVALATGIIAQVLLNN